MLRAERKVFPAAGRFLWSWWKHALQKLGMDGDAIKTTACKFCVTLQFGAEASYCKLHWWDFYSLQQMLRVPTPVVHHHSPLLDCGNTDAGMRQTYIYHLKSILESLTDSRQHRTEETFMQNTSAQCKAFYSDHVFCFPNRFISLTPVVTFLYFFDKIVCKSP